MARKTYNEILKGLAPESTGNQPIEVSMPFLYYHFGVYHIVALVTGGQSDNKFAKKNRDHGRLLGIAIYHPQDGTGEYLTPTRAKEKFGIDLLKLSDSKSAKLGAKDIDDAVKLPHKLREDAAQRFMKNRMSLEDYNSHVMLLAAQRPEYGKRYLYFKLNPEVASRFPNPQRRKIIWLRLSVFALFFGFLVLSHAIADYHYQVVELKKDAQKQTEEITSLKTRLSQQTAISGVMEGGYNAGKIIPGDEKNGDVADHVRGNTSSKIAVIEYVDFQCSACASVYQDMNVLYQRYGNQVMFISRNFPLESIHSNAIAAARAAEAAAQQGHYWEMHDALFAQQSTWSEASAMDLPKIFRNMINKAAPDVNLTTFMADMKEENVISKVSFDQAIGHYVHDVTYTPTIYINNEKIDLQANSSESFLTQVDRAIRAKL